MIVLDTNVISEVMRPVPDAAVVDWLAAQDALDLATTTINIAEIQRGIVRLPRGKKRRSLEERFAAFVDEGFRGRLFPFDKAAAFASAQAAAAREGRGLHADPVDMMIAGIVEAVGARLATRNAGDFEGCGITLMDPWNS